MQCEASPVRQRAPSGVRNFSQFIVLFIILAAHYGIKTKARNYPIIVKYVHIYLRKESGSFPYAVCWRSCTTQCKASLGRHRAPCTYFWKCIRKIVAVIFDPNFTNIYIHINIIFKYIQSYLKLFPCAVGWLLVKTWYTSLVFKYNNTNIIISNGIIIYYCY